jgi:hypothetical protein
MSMSDDIRSEARLGRSTLTTIGRQLGAVYQEVVADRIPPALRTALQRLDRAGDAPHASSEGSPDRS